MKKLIILIILSLVLIGGCEYSSAGAPINNGWIGTLENPYVGIVSANFYSYNGTGWERVPAVGIKGDTGAQGIQGIQGIQGVPGDDGFGQGAKVFRSNTQSIIQNVWTDVQFNREEYDTDNIFNTAANTTLVAKTAGVYTVFGQAYWPAGTVGMRGEAIEKNDGGVYVCIYANYPDATYGSVGMVSTLVYLNIGDYLKFCVWQTSTGSINLTVSANTSPSFAMQRIGN